MENQDKKSELELIKEQLLLWLKNWPYFVISGIICGIIGVAYMKLKTPEYQIEAKVALRQNDMGSSGGGFSESTLMKSLGFGKSGGVSVEDESDIMGSQGYVKKVITNLKLNNQYVLKEFAGLWNTDLYNATPIELTYQDSYRDTLAAVLKFNLKVEGEHAKVKMKAGKRNIGSYEISGFPATLDTPYGSFVFSKTSAFNSFGKSFNLLVTVVGSDLKAQIYRQVLSVEMFSKTSDIILMNTIDANVDRAKIILQELINVYNKEYSKDKEITGDKTLQFLDEKLERVSNDLIEADQNIEEFKRKNKLTNVEVDATAFLQQNLELQPKLLEAQIQLNLMEVIDGLISDPGNESALIPFSMSVTDPTIAQVIVAYNDLLVKKNSLLESSNPQNPMVVQYSKQLQAMRENLKVSLDNVKKGFQITVNSLKRKELEFDSRIGSLPSVEKNLLELMRNQEVQQTMYIFLKEKREETAITSLSVLPKLRVIDEPYVLMDKVAPNKMKVMAMVIIIGGLLIPLTIIYLKPYVRRRKE